MVAMSDLLDRTRARLLSVTSTEEPRGLPAAAAAAAGWAAVLGAALCVLVALVGWLAGSTGTPADAAVAGVQAWLVGHGSGLQAGAVTVTAVPLGLALVFAAVLWRMCAWAASTAAVADLRSAGSGTAIAAAVYATLAAAAALLVGSGPVEVSPVRAFAAALVLSVVPCALGMLRGAGLLDQLWRWLPEYARAGLRGAVAGVLAMCAAGSMLVTAALALDFGTAANVAHALGAGVVGGAILTAVGVLLLPNAALLGVAYLLGPGFAFGAGTLVAPSGVRLGRVPAFPLLAGLPDEGPALWWAPALLAVPVLAGVLAGAVALRASAPSAAAAWDRAALRGALAGLLGALATGGLTALAGGAVGPGRMSDVGARWLECTGVAAASMTLAAALTAVLLCWRARRSGEVSSRSRRRGVVPGWLRRARR
jgi:hypothetical protein